jgi:hypothetical protein
MEMIAGTLEAALDSLMGTISGTSQRGPRSEGWDIEAWASEAI